MNSDGHNGLKIWDKSLGTKDEDLLYSLTVEAVVNLLLAGCTNGGQEGGKTQDSRGIYDYWLMQVEQPLTSHPLNPLTIYGNPAMEELRIRS